MAHLHVQANSLNNTVRCMAIFHTTYTLRKKGILDDGHSIKIH